MKGGQTQSRRLGVAVTVSTGCRDHLQRRPGTFAIESRISFVLRQLLVGRAPRPQLVAQFLRVLRTFSKLSHLFWWEDTKVVIILEFVLGPRLVSKCDFKSRKRFLRLSDLRDSSDLWNLCRPMESRRSFLAAASKFPARVDVRSHNDESWVVVYPCKTQHFHDQARPVDFVWLHARARTWSSSSLDIGD